MPLNSASGNERVIDNTTLWKYLYALGIRGYSYFGIWEVQAGILIILRTQVRPPS